MKGRHIVISILAMLLLSAGSCFAQNGNDPAKQEKELMEAIQDQVNRLEIMLDLEGWQVFFVDSIYVSSYKGLQEELMGLQKKGTQNTDLYQLTQDKWMEKIYQSMKKVLNEEQWKLYDKREGGKAKKERDKRAQKNVKVK